VNTEDFSPAEVKLTSPVAYYHVRPNAVTSPLAAFVSCQARAAPLALTQLGTIPRDKACCALFRPPFARSDSSVNSLLKDCPMFGVWRYILGRFYE